MVRANAKKSHAENVGILVLSFYNGTTPAPFVVRRGHPTRPRVRGQPTRTSSGLDHSLLSHAVSAGNRIWLSAWTSWRLYCSRRRLFGMAHHSPRRNGGLQKRLVTYCPQGMQDRADRYGIQLNTIIPTGIGSFISEHLRIIGDEDRPHNAFWEETHRHRTRGLAAAHRTNPRNPNTKDELSQTERSHLSDFSSISLSCWIVLPKIGASNGLLT